MRNMGGVLLPALLTVHFPANAQKRHSKPYVAVVILQDGSRVEGVLGLAGENELILSHKKSPAEPTRIHPKEIAKIKVRRKGKIGRGAALGAGIGVVTGVILGFIQGDDPGCEGCWFEWKLTAEEYALGYSMLLAPTGALTGAVIGSKSRKFEIRGNVEAYLDQLPELQKYTVDGQREFPAGYRP